MILDSRDTDRPPGEQLQIDFGERRAIIGDENVKVYLFVSTLGYSRRLYVRPFRSQRQESWFSGVEGAFRHFGGVTEGGSSSELLTVVGQDSPQRGLAQPRKEARLCFMGHALMENRNGLIVGSVTIRPAFLVCDRFSHLQKSPGRRSAVFGWCNRRNRPIRLRLLGPSNTRFCRFTPGR